MKRPRVLLADDHTLVADGLRRILEPECEVVGAVEDGRSLLAAAEKLKPDIILLDISMPLLNGAECQGDLCYHARGRYLRHSGLSSRSVRLCLEAVRCDGVAQRRPPGT